MKTLLILLCIVCGMHSTVAQTSSKTTTLTLGSVPEIVKNTFTTEFPTLQAKWEMDDKNYKAIYADPKNNSKGIIIYDVNGKVIHRDTEVNTLSKPE